MNDDKIKEIEELIVEFSDEHLNDEFKALNLKLLNALVNCDEINLKRGKPENWACGIVYAIGQLNFLFERSFPPYVHQDFLCAYFDATKQTTWNKSRDIRRLLKLKLNDKKYTSKFILSLNIPESDDDLNRIRTFEEVKLQIKAQHPNDINDVNNRKLTELLDEVLKNNNDDLYDDLISHLRTSFFIKIGFRNELIIKNGNKYRTLLFTRIDKCELVQKSFPDEEPSIKFFLNVVYDMMNENFEGVMVNNQSDDYFISRDMIKDVYPYYDSIDYFRIYL